MTTEDELLQFCLAWDQAMVGNDADEISKFMSDDWILVGTEGGITTKSRFLSFIRSGELTHSRMDSDETSIKFYEDTGIVTSRGTSAGNYKGQSFELYEWSTSIFIRKNGQWLCVHTMLTPAKK